MNKRFEFLPAVGGRVEAFVQRDGRIDLSIVAPEGPSAAVYVTSSELCEFSLAVLAAIPMESGREIGELIEERRPAPPAVPSPAANERA